MKDTFYFTHDYNARNDPKILMLRSEFNNEGYALYFYCVETMAEDKEGCIYREAIGGLSIGYCVSKELLTKFIDFAIKIKLFIENKKGIFSQRLIDHKNSRKLLSEKGREGANKKWAGYREAIGVANSTLIAGKESKEKEIEIKEKEILVKDNMGDKSPAIKPVRIKKVFIEPTLEEIQDYCNLEQLIIPAVEFYDEMVSTGWVLKRGPVKDWKATIRNWNRNRIKWGKEQKTAPRGQFLNKIQRVDAMFERIDEEIKQAKEKGVEIRSENVEWLSKTAPKQISAIK